MRIKRKNTCEAPSRVPRTRSVFKECCHGSYSTRSLPDFPFLTPTIPFFLNGRAAGPLQVTWSMLASRMGPQPPGRAGDSPKASLELDPGGAWAQVSGLLSQCYPCHHVSVQVNIGRNRLNRGCSGNPKFWPCLWGTQLVGQKPRVSSPPPGAHVPALLGRFCLEGMGFRARWGACNLQANACEERQDSASCLSHEILP